MDIGKVAVALRCISDDLEDLDRERVTNAMVKLGGLADTHSFFRVLYTKWFYFRSVGFENTEAVVSGALNELRALPEELPLYQKQIQRFFELVLDIDKAGRISDSEFYAWSEQTREQKKKCDEGSITAEEFQRWLKAEEVWPMVTPLPVLQKASNERTFGKWQTSFS